MLSRVGPLLEPIHRMPRADYHRWIDQTQPDRLRLFHSNALEALTVTPWAAVPLSWAGVMLFVNYARVAHPTPWQLSGAGTLVLLVVGLLAWMQAEYVLHRWLFHSRAIPNLLHFFLHGIHHKTPRDGGRLVFPLVPGLLIGLALFVVLENMIELVLGAAQLHWDVAWTLFTGIVLGYVVYDCLHYHVHAPGDDSLLRRWAHHMRAHHMRHHVSTVHPGNYGVSCPLTDYAYGTLLGDRLQ